MAEKREQRTEDRLERRVYQASTLELRKAGDGEKAVLAGYAAVFNATSEDLGGFREVIMPGAFTKSLQNRDVRALWQHDSKLVMGRASTGTLRLVEDDTGLHVEIDPPDTQWARDAMTTVERGDVNQMSFAFEVPPGGETWGDLPDGTWLRKLWEVDLWEVSGVTFPAYPQTSIAVRDHLEALRAEASSGNNGEGGHAGAGRDLADERERELALIQH